MAEQITLDGRNLFGEDRYGDWKTTDIEGWWDTPDRKSNDSGIDLADGDYDLPEFYEKRLVTIEGRVKTRSHEEQHEAMIRLNGALARGSGILAVAGHGPTLWARAKLDAATRWTIRTDRYAQFQLRLKCPDPRKFGDARTFTATTDESAPVHHKGNYVATPRFVVYGDMPDGYILSLGGRNFVVTRILSENYPHSIDYRDGRLRVNGQLITGMVAGSNIKLVEPGLRTTLSLAPRVGGWGRVECTVEDTYI